MFYINAKVIKEKFMIEPIRCLLNSSVRDAITVNEYKLKTGQHITEIITDLGKDKSVREIYKDALGNPEKVVDKVFGQIETYYPSKSGIIRRSSDGAEKFIPNLTVDKLMNLKD